MKCRDCGCDLERPDPDEIDWEAVAVSLGYSREHGRHFKAHVTGCEVTICDECDLLRKAEDGAGFEQMSDERKFEIAGIPRNAWGFDINDCKISDDQRHHAIEAIGLGLPVTVIGGVGVGKSCFCAIIACRMIKNGGQALFIKTGPWLKRTGSLEFGDREAEVIRVAEFPGLLVMDEFVVPHGKDGPTPWKQETILQIIDNRSGGMLDTLINTSSQLDVIGECWRVDVVSRLKQGLIVEWRGRDRR